MTAQAATSLLPLPAPTPGQMFPWLQLQAGKRSRAHTCTQTNAAVQLVPPGHNAGGNSALHGVTANSSAGLHSPVLSSAQRTTIKVSWELSSAWSCSSDMSSLKEELKIRLGDFLSKTHKKYSSWETRIDGSLLSGLPVAVSEVHPLSPITKEQEELAGKGSSRVCRQLQVPAHVQPMLGRGGIFSSAWKAEPAPAALLGEDEMCKLQGH